MSNKKCINFGTIFKRSSCINSESKSNGKDSRRVSENLKIQLESESRDGRLSPSTKELLYSYIECLCDPNNANLYFRDPLYVIETLNGIDKESSKYLMNSYIERVLPYVSDLSTIEESVNRFDLTDEQKSTIIEGASMYSTADRILKNHNTMSKRFNLDEEVSKFKAKGLRDIVESYCSKIDTYTIKPYQKMNLCIEEMMYLFEKNNVDYDKKKFVEYVTEYFLLRSPELSPSDLKGYRVALTEGHCLSEEDLEGVEYLVSPAEAPCDEPTISDRIHNFLLEREKTLQGVTNLIDEFTKYSTAAIVSNITKVLWLIWNIRRANIFDEEDIEKYIQIWFESIVKRIVDCLDISADDPMCVTVENVRVIREDIATVYRLLISRAEDSYEYMKAMSSFKTNIDLYLLEPLRIVLGLAYPRYNIESLDYVNRDNIEPVDLKEFKTYNFRDLVRSSNKLRSIIDSKINSIPVNESFISKDGMSKNILEAIGEDYKADICVAQYSFHENNAEDLNDIFNSICENFNYQMKIDGIYTQRSYYMINPGILEVHIKESVPVLVDETVMDLCSKFIIAPELNYYIDQMAMVEAYLNSYESFTEENEIKPIREKIVESVNNKDLTTEHYEVAMEALSLLDDATKEDAELFTEKFSDMRFNAILESNGNESVFTLENRIRNNILTEWTHETDIVFNIQLEAYQILCAVLEDNKDIKKKDLKDKDKKEEKSKETKEEIKKNPFKGININSIKLYLEGIKSKTKKMSQKEKEISRNMDNTFRVFVKSMKDAMISDRREAIIKGSVIPSFSKCVKIAIGLAGIGFIAGNPIPPLLIALGGFITSKRLTHRERMLLLDELETELQVIDKEIQMAESKNQMKKYRYLLNTKKDIQRQYQRIRFNLRIGKDLLPNSSIGVKHFDD